MIDAFYSDSIPFHLATREFLELARSRLAPGGTVVDQHHRRRPRPRVPPLPLDAADVPRRLPDGRDPPVRGERETGLEGIRNIILVAGEGAAPSKEFLHERWAELRKQSPGAPDLTVAIRGRVDAAVATEDVPVLTDDYAPTDALLLLFG